MRTRLPVALAAAAGLLASGCISHNLNSPRPLDEGELQIGLHVGGVTSVGVAEEPEDLDGDGDIDSDDSAGSGEVTGFTVTGTVRHGLGDGMEVGVDISTIGATAAFKYGFFEHDEPLQISVITSVGAYGWGILSFGAGALIGYTLGDVFTPYVGYRHYGYYIEGIFHQGTATFGTDIEFTKGLGVLLEVNAGAPLGEFDEGLYLVTFTGGFVTTF